jgi:hypothetical protein
MPCDALLLKECNGVADWNGGTGSILGQGSLLAKRERRASQPKPFYHADSGLRLGLNDWRTALAFLDRMTQQKYVGSRA